MTLYEINVFIYFIGKQTFLDSFLDCEIRTGCRLSAVRVRTGDDPPPVSQDHLAALHQRFKDAGDVGGSFVGLVDHEDVTVLHRLHL